MSEIEVGKFVEYRDNLGNNSVAIVDDILAKWGSPKIYLIKDCINETLHKRFAESLTLASGTFDVISRTMSDPPGASGPSEPKARKFGRYFWDVSKLKVLDLYRFFILANVTNPAYQHAIKKIVVAGSRGAKSERQDIEEAIASLNRALEIMTEDGENGTNLSFHADAPVPAFDAPGTLHNPAPVGTLPIDGRLVGWNSRERQAHAAGQSDMRDRCSNILRKHAIEALDLAMEVRSDGNSKLAARLELRADEFSALAEEMSNLPLTK